VLGRKRHILTDTLGLLLAVNVHCANVQDRDGAEALLREARRSFPFLERIIADAGYQGRKMDDAIARTGTWVLQIVRRCDQHRFVVLPKRWIVERTLAWISRCRRLARDYERHARKAAAFVRLAMVRLMLRRLAASPFMSKTPGTPPDSKVEPGRLQRQAAEAVRVGRGASGRGTATGRVRSPVGSAWPHSPMLAPDRRPP